LNDPEIIAKWIVPENAEKNTKTVTNELPADQQVTPYHRCNQK
jgi:hypothetical protein